MTTTALVITCNYIIITPPKTLHIVMVIICPIFHLFIFPPPIHVQDNNNNFAFYLMKVLLMQIQQYSLPVALQWSSIYTDDMIQRLCGMHLSAHARTN